MTSQTDLTQRIPDYNLRDHLSGLLQHALAESNDDEREALLRTAIEALADKPPPEKQLTLRPLAEVVAAGEQCSAVAFSKDTRALIRALLGTEGPVSILIHGAPDEEALAALLSAFEGTSIAGAVPSGRLESSDDCALVCARAVSGRFVLVCSSDELPNSFGDLRMGVVLKAALEAGAAMILVRQLGPAGIQGADLSRLVSFDVRREFAQARAKDVAARCGEALTPASARRLDRLVDSAAAETLAGLVRRVAAVGSDQVDALVAKFTPKVKELDEKKKPEAEVAWIERGRYHLDLLNTDTGLREIAAIMRAGRKRKGARLLAFGVSGSGKTEAVKWLADELGVPLHLKRANDLLAYHLGDFEKRIHKAFAKARDAGALLFIDEAEALMMTRQLASRATYIVSLTKTFLTELDRYDGLFAACTNSMELLDDALMRRMTMKVEFKPLRSGHRAVAYERELTGYAGPPGDTERWALGRMEGLCLGDIGNVARRLELLRDSDASRVFLPDAVIELLAAEVAARSEGTGRRIGF